MRSAILAAMLIAALATAAQAQVQSSSLYLVKAEAPTRTKGLLIEPSLQASSLTSVQPPTPRVFAINDLITVVIRESSSATSESKLDTKKEDKIDGGITAFPTFNLEALLNGQLKGGKLNNGPAVSTNWKNDFKTNGDYERKDEMTTRLTARVIDVKPNGTLVVEARTDVRSDRERSVITVTGQCRPDDVTVDNTVLSTQMFDLRVDKQHEGEIKKNGGKGIITKVLETIFNF